MSDPFFAAMHQVIDGAVGQIERMGQQCRATGNHLVAQNDEPEPGDLTPTDLAAIDAEFAPVAPRATCGKASGMCAMFPDGFGRPAVGVCPECGVDCPPPFTEDWFAQVDRQVQRRKDTDALRQERELRALQEQMDRRPA